MTLRTAHGTAKRNGTLVAFEVMPPDEQPAGVPDPKPEPAPLPPPPYAAGSPEVREAARRGGLARAGTTALADSLGMTGPNATPYRRRAEAFRRLSNRWLERHIAGGELPPDVRLLVKLGALQAAAAERAFDAGNDEQGALRANDARTMLMTAREYAAKAAHTRKKRNAKTDGSVAQLHRRIGVEGSKP